MHTLSLEVPDDVYERLQHAAAEAGQSVENLAVTWLSSNVGQVADDPLEALIGSIDSGGIPWGDQHDAYIGRELLNSHDPEQTADE